MTPPSFRASRILALSWAGEDVPALVEAARRRLSGFTILDGDHWLIACERDDCVARGEGYGIALTAPRLFDRVYERMASPSDLLANLSAGGFDPRHMAPPFRALWRAKDGRSIQATTDYLGLGHLFTTQDAGIVGISSSSSLLGEVFGRAASADALAAFALFGAFTSDQTPYESVRKLMAGERAWADRGVLRIETVADGAGSRGTVVDAVRAAVNAMLRAAPDTQLELSGGLDSRIILAAILDDARRGRAAMTIGPASHETPDMVVARRLAAMSGLHHEVFDSGRVDQLDGQAYGGLLDRIVDGYDLMTNPLDKVSVVLAGNSESARPRFGGQNGEIIRGFFYSGQPLDAMPSESLARRLIEWRLIGNDRVASSLLSAAAKDRQAVARTDMTRLILSGGGKNWGDTLDRFYIAQRMQAWAGNGASNRFIDRPQMLPFFDRDFVQAAQALAPDRKANSGEAYRLLASLDPALARVPLDNGITPANAAREGLAARADGWRRFVMLAGRKITQRLRQRSRGTLGSADAIALWHGHGLHRRLDLHALSRLDLFEPAALQAVGDGAVTLDRPSLGFLLLCDRLARR